MGLSYFSAYFRLVKNPTGANKGREENKSPTLGTHVIGWYLIHHTQKKPTQNSFQMYVILWRLTDKCTSRLLGWVLDSIFIWILLEISTVLFNYFDIIYVYHVFHKILYLVTSVNMAWIQQFFHHERKGHQLWASKNIFLCVTSRVHIKLTIKGSVDYYDHIFQPTMV